MSARNESASHLRGGRGSRSNQDNREVGERALSDPILSLPQGPAAALSTRNESASLLRGCGGSQRDLDGQEVRERALPDLILSLL